jgi:ribosomal protein S18 acetylase RimI-like enzyme
LDEFVKVIDLKERRDLLQQYVDLRNQYCKLLLTSQVDLPETEGWIEGNLIKIRGMVKENILLGVVILYLDRDGEITFFVKKPNQGMGSQLLRIIEEVGRQENLEYIWGWVLEDNFIGKRAFEKNRFIKEGTRERKFEGQVKSGTVYKKYLVG